MADESKENALRRAFNKILGRRIKLLKEEKNVQEDLTEVNKESSKAYKDLSSNIKDINRSNADLARTQAKTNKEVGIFKRLIREAGNSARDFAKEHGPNMTAGAASLALAVKSYNTAVEASQKSTKQFLQTSQGITSLSTSYKEVAKRAHEYQKMQMLNTEVAWEFGKTTEEITAINDKWISTMRYDKLTDKNRESLRKLTEQTVMYADILGEDAAQVQEEATERMFKYGESHEEALKNIAETKFAVIELNESLKDMSPNQAAVFDDDFRRRLKAVSEGTRGYTQDLGLMSAALSEAIERGQRLGMTYDQSMDAAQAFSEFVSGSNMSETGRGMTGLRLLEGFQQNLDEAGNIKKGYLAQFDPETQKQLKLIAKRMQQGQLATLSANQLERTLAQTDVGMRARLETVQGIAGQGQRADIALMGLGVEEEQATMIADLLMESGGNIDKVVSQIRGREGSARQKRIQAEQGRALQRLVQARTGAVGQMGADATMKAMGIDARVGMLGKVAGFGERSEVTGAGSAILAGGVLLNRARQRGVATSAVEMAEEASGMDLDQSGFVGAPPEGPGGSPGMPGVGLGTGMGESVRNGMIAALARYDEQGRLRTTGGGGGSGPDRESTLNKIIETQGKLHNTTLQIGKYVFGGTLSKLFARQVLGAGGKQIAKKGLMSGLTRGGSSLLGNVARGGASTLTRGGASTIGRGALLGGLGTTAAGLTASGAIVGSIFAAPAAAFSYGVYSGTKPDAQLRKLQKERMDSGFFDPITAGGRYGITTKAWAKFAQALAEEPESVTKKLVKDGVIHPSMGKQVLALKASRQNMTSPSSVGPKGAARGPGAAITAASVARGSAPPGVSGALSGVISNIEPGGDIILRIKNGMQIPAQYDLAKSNSY